MTRMNEEAQQPLVRAVDWLVRQQGADGGWHSATYGQLKDGAAVTALVLYALAHLSPTLGTTSEQARRKGFSFLERGIAKRGTIASPDGTLDFPTYAAALWCMAQRSSQDAGQSGELCLKIIAYLVAAQVAKPRGFEADSPSYGGWDFLGHDDARGVTTGTNVSVTSYVLEALAGELDYRRQLNGSRSITLERQAMAIGKAYVLRCQQPDGGFAFTCEPASLNNKAAYHDEKLTQPRSYGTATCDGIRALLACGLAPTDEPAAKGLAWLANRPGLEIVPGFEELPPEAGWQRGLRLYYFTRLAGLLKHLPDRDERSAAVTKLLTGLQKADGSWANESDRMRENDPLIATPLAMVALTTAP
jgi:prenyltransferase/squalene oxidase-like repeat protein